MKFLAATILFVGLQATVLLAASNEYQDLAKEDSLVVAEDIKVQTQDISIVDKKIFDEKTNDYELKETVKEIKTNDESEEDMHTKVYEYTIQLGGMTYKNEIIFEEDRIVFSPVMISEDVLAQYEKSIELGGITVKYRTEIKENHINFSTLTTPEDIKAQYEEIKINEVTPVVDLSGKEQKSQTDVGGTDHLEIEGRPKSDETYDEDKGVEEQIYTTDVGGAKYKWKIVTEEDDIELLPLFTPEIIRAQLGCSVYSYENACAKGIDENSGGKCQWRLDTAAGVESCLPEKVETILTDEIGGIEYKYKVTFEGNTVKLDVVTPTKKALTQISEKYDIADENDGVKIPEFSPSLRGAKVQ